MWKRLDPVSKEPWCVALGAALGALVAFAPASSGLFALLAFLIVFTDASLLVTALAGGLSYALAIAALDARAVELGRTLNENPGATQKFIYSFPIVALLGLERNATAGGLAIGLAVAPVLAL